jgi:hypothetical protein
MKKGDEPLKASKTCKDIQRLTLENHITHKTSIMLKKYALKTWVTHPHSLKNWNLH